MPHRLPLEEGYSGIKSGCCESKGGGNSKNHLYGEVKIIIGTLIALLVFLNLFLGPKDSIYGVLSITLSLLILLPTSIILMVNGAYEFLSTLSQQSQFP